MGELSGTDCFLSENTSVFHVHYYLLKFGSFNVWNYLYTVLKIFFVTWLCFGLWLSQWYVTFSCKFLLVLNDRQIWQTTFYICSSWKLKKKSWKRFISACHQNVKDAPALKHTWQVSKTSVQGIFSSYRYDYNFQHKLLITHSKYFLKLAYWQRLLHVKQKTISHKLS